MLCWNVAKQKTGDHFLKNMACTNGNRLLGDDFHAILDKTEAHMLQNTKKENWKWIV